MLALPSPFNRSPVLDRILRSRVAAALAYPHDVDRYLELVHPAWSLSEVRARIESVHRQTADTVTLRLRPNSNWRGFEAGQFVQLSVEIDGVRRTRCYSPANSVHATDGLLELTVKAHEWGFVSRHLFEHAAAGDTVLLSQAQGDFKLPQDRPQSVLLISGGSGITPVMAMLRTLADEAFAGAITFLHYARSPADVLYADDLEALAAMMPNLILSTVTDPADLFSPAHLVRFAPDYDRAETFVCGPGGLMDAVRALWQEQGLEGRLHMERFTPAAAVPADDAVTGDLHFAASETFAANDGRSVLEQAEAAGLRPQSGCRMGICSTCTCRKTAGTVRNTITGELHSEADEDIRICVSVPVGDVTVEL